ncbi:E3 ubiquitin/ISG15 ligase TRIM25-like [Amphiprion ocellaris]|uniref:Tripartite motif-containing protein 16-like n=1 Tax=Amphiprion ocellaris TaxID=80972 RepID=A0AAQ5ZGX9_AMPOC|nr:E3 ubiquitin/ISG15 ligase TRIM25-like [Amphiprion ocellaris]
MAEKQQEFGADLDHGHLCCSVCLELLREPVSIQCGHSYCRGCIEGCWDQEEKKDQFSCPQCRESFSARPVLRTNTMLAEVVEKLRRTSTEQVSPSLACAGPEDVACDFCCGTRRNKASTSCLTCLASYCPAHLEAHHSVPVLKMHQLVSATSTLQEKMCTKHHKLMEVYCETDKMCICYLCTVDEHKRHTVLSATAERAKEQKQLIVKQKAVQERFQEREMELKKLIQATKDFKSCCQTAVKSIDDISDELVSEIKRTLTAANELVAVQETKAIVSAEGLQLQLEEDITKLRRRDDDLEQLSHMDDHVHFIQMFPSLSTSCESPDLPLGAVSYPRRLMETVTECISELRDNIKDLLKSALPKISATVSTVRVMLPVVPNTREEFLLYCCSLTLDANSVSQTFSLSQEYRRVQSHSFQQCRSSHPDRFGYGRQVLCKEGLTERCYWEVSWSCSKSTSSRCTWSVAVSYKDISRKSSDSEFGKNTKSWSLECSSEGYTFQHNSRSVAVSGPKSSKIGVYLDHKAGILSFYSISDSMTLLHKEHTTFTQPLYPGIGQKNCDGCGCHAEVMKLW